MHREASGGFKKIIQVCRYDFRTISTTILSVVVLKANKQTKLESSKFILGLKENPKLTFTYIICQASQ